MAVTLPVVLLLLDFWPLGRWGTPNGGAARRLITEKLPLLVLSGALGVVTLVAQTKAGATNCPS